MPSSATQRSWQNGACQAIQGRIGYCFSASPTSLAPPVDGLASFVCLWINWQHSNDWPFPLLWPQSVCEFVLCVWVCCLSGALELKARLEHSNCLCLRLIFCSILAKLALWKALCTFCVFCCRCLWLLLLLVLLLYLFLRLFSTKCRFNCSLFFFLFLLYFRALHCLAIVRFWLGSIVSQLWSLYCFLGVNNEVHGKRSWQLYKTKVEISIE